MQAYKIFTFALISCFTLTGCLSTTLKTTTGVERKQLMLFSANEVNSSANQTYRQIITQANAKGLLNRNIQQLNRVKAIANNLVAHSSEFKTESKDWTWELNIIQSNELNAFCAAGGKIVVYSGIIDRLKLTDDELAAIIGHEVAHALREHAREKSTWTAIQNVSLQLISKQVGLSGTEQQIAALLAKLGVGLPHSRSQENEADVIGLELMARAGYNPNAAISLWQKMEQASGTGMPQFLSTHPAPDNRKETLGKLIPTVMPLYLAAKDGSKKTLNN